MKRAPSSESPATPRAIDYMAIVLILVYVWRIQDMFPILGALQLPMLASLGALGFWIAKGYAARSVILFRHPLMRVATFILAWMVLSVPGSVYQGMSFSFVLNDHLKTFLMMMIVASSIRGFADVERLVLANLLGAGLYCLKILTSFQVGASGRLGNLFYYDSNDLAMLIVCMLPIAVYFIASGRKASHRLLAAACAALFMVAIVRTGSRGGFLGLIAVGLFLLLGYRAIKARLRFGAVIGAVVTLTVVAGPQYWSMMGTMLHPKDDYNWAGNNDVGRMAIWTRGMGYMADRPVLGVGVAAFPVAEGTISAISERQDRGIGLKWSTAHNSFVQIGAELGVPGLIAFLAFLWHFAKSNMSIVHMAKRRMATPDAGALAQALMGTLIGYLVCGFFLSQAYSAFLYAIAAIVTGFTLTQKAQSATGTQPRPASSGRSPPVRPRATNLISAHFGQ